MVLTVPVYCDCAVRRYERGQTEARQRMRRAYLERFFAHTEIGERLRSCNLENWEPRSGAEEALEQVRQFIDELPDRLRGGGGLVLLGGVGNGKTHLAAAVYNAAVELDYPAVFQVAPSLMHRLNRTYRDGEKESEYDLLSALTEADLLVLDDVGAEKATERVVERLYTIIDGRYRGLRSTVLTGNLDNPGDLARHLGNRTFDRLVESCRFVVNRATSYRQEKRLR